MGTQLRIGVWDQLDDGGVVEVHQLYRERLAMVEAAEAAGFYTFLLAEHHGTPLSTVPRPGLFLAAVAARTTRIRLGMLCFILPLEHPLAMIEQVCMLDQLSNGRLDLGVSRGISPIEQGFFGIDPTQIRELYAESLEILLAGLTQDRLTHDGRHFHLHDVPMQLHPIQQPHPPLWYATADPASAPRLAQQRFNLVAGGPAAVAGAVIDAYWQTWDELDAADRADDPCVGVARHILIADSDEEAVAIGEQAHARWFGSMMKLWHEHGDHSWDDMFSWKAAREHETFILGTADTVRERLAELLEVSGANYLNLVFSWGSLTHEQSRRSLAEFAEHVMPALAARPRVAA